MKHASVPASLPSELHQFFWDTQATQVNPQTHPHYVINRLLDKGNLTAARWVLRSFPKEMIIDTFRTIRDFSPWNGSFWAGYLHIPEQEVACLNPHYRAMRKKLWPY